MTDSRKRKDITVVIRTAGERTVEISKRLVQNQIDESRIHAIEEKPFFNAVKKTIEIGSRSSTAYLLALDADILLYPDAIDYMMYEVDQFDFDQHLKISFWVSDKFRGRFKSGIHLYNNIYSIPFYNFLSCIDPYSDFLRAESENMKKFAVKEGLIYSFAPYHVIAKHDYFQYYRDLYSKYRLRYKRCVADGNMDNITKYIHAKQAEYPDDQDYIFVREIFNTANENISVDEILLKLGMQEKEPINYKMFESITESLSCESVMQKVKDDLDLKLKNWINSYNEIKEFLTKNYHLNSISGPSAIYGTGDICDLVLSAGKSLRVKAVIDNNPEKYGDFVNGIPVMALEEAIKLDIKNIIIGSIYHKDEIRQRIQNTVTNGNLNLIALDSI